MVSSTFTRSTEPTWITAPLVLVQRGDELGHRVAGDAVDTRLESVQDLELDSAARLCYGIRISRPLQQASQGSVPRAYNKLFFADIFDAGHEQHFPNRFLDCRTRRSILQENLNRDLWLSRTEGRSATEPHCGARCPAPAPQQDPGLGQDPVNETV